MMTNPPMITIRHGIARRFDAVAFLRDPAGLNFAISLEAARALFPRTARRLLLGVAQRLDDTMSV